MKRLILLELICNSEAKELLTKLGQSQNELAKDKY